MRFLTLIVLAIAAMAQISLPGSAPEKPAEPAPDPLGRATPRGSMTGFLRAVQAGRYQQAARYLDIPESRRNTTGVTLARELQVLLDTSYDVPLMKFSDKSAGAAEENVSADADHIGEINVGDQSVDLVMVRVHDAESGKIWLIGRQTLDRVPRLSGEVTGFSYVEKLPEWFQQRIFGLAVWQLVGAVVLAVLAYGLAWLTILTIRFILRRANVTIKKPPAGTAFLLAVLIHSRLIHLLSLPFLMRTYYRRFSNVIVVAGLMWLILRGIDAASERLRQRALDSGQLAEGSWVVLGKRILKVLVVLAFVLAMLALLGFDTSTALAGLGIGGIAVALAAQKTIENVFGGVSVASDRVIRVGDTLRFGTTVGTVIDIGLRSTRLKTVERTELSIPNGSLATMNVENLSMREKFLFNTTLPLQYETTRDQLENVLLSIRAMLAEHPKVETPGARTRFIGYGDSALQVEINLYILAMDFEEMAQIREELLFRIMDIVERAGTSFAVPSRAVYVVNKSDGAVTDEAAAGGGAG